MENITNIISANLQVFRKKRQMTLQDLSDLTGVSKSMLGEIERGSSNPTITVLWKICTGLKITITDLIHQPLPEYKLVHKSDWKTLYEGNYNLSLIFEYDHAHNFEVYHLVFQPGAKHESMSHQKGIAEYTMVYEGELVIDVNGASHKLVKGDSFIFEAEHPHSYHNDSKTTACAYSLIYYPNNA